MSAHSWTTQNICKHCMMERKPYICKHCMMEPKPCLFHWYYLVNGKWTRKKPHCLRAGESPCKTCGRAANASGFCGLHDPNRVYKQAWTRQHEDTLISLKDSGLTYEQIAVRMDEMFDRTFTKSAIAARLQHARIKDRMKA